MEQWPTNQQKCRRPILNTSAEWHDANKRPPDSTKKVYKHLPKPTRWNDKVNRQKIRETGSVPLVSNCTSVQNTYPAGLPKPGNRGYIATSSTWRRIRSTSILNSSPYEQLLHTCLRSWDSTACTLRTEDDDSGGHRTQRISPCCQGRRFPRLYEGFPTKTNIQRIMEGTFWNSTTRNKCTNHCLKLHGSCEPRGKIPKDRVAWKEPISTTKVLPN